MSIFIKYNLLLKIAAILPFFSILNNENKFMGNWQTCSRDGKRIELYVSGNSFKYCIENYGVLHDMYTYQIKQDTLLYNDSALHAIKKAKLSFPNENTMHWDYIGLDEHWEFHKIFDRIREYTTNKMDAASIKIYEKVKRDLERRAVNNKCPDKRSKEEKAKDSIAPVYFQF